mgnify:CR=1 FL=1
MGKFDGVSDEELIARLRAGETAIEDYLMEKYKGLVRQKARAMFLIGGDTDDLIQEGMIGLFKAVRDFQTDKEHLLQLLPECVLTGRYTVPFRILTARSTSL